ncbi:penicillin-binding protein 1B [Nevskia sp.]|uniref:penicillin-binding protein 1B n=1 Tax=Nevskia sp. TaxID=1929292 RepID=UPI0025F37115|nr:penicillin-binding protein 1B [Nevskia sp.]
MIRIQSPLLRWLLIGLALSISIGLVVLSFWLVRLDREVRTLYAGVRWVLPAQVYAAPLELYPGARIKLPELKRELDRLGYRASDELTGPGTYVLAADEIRIDTRGFAFWDGVQAESRVAIRCDDSAVSAIRAMGSDQSVDLLRLDPMLIGSIYPSHSGEDRVLVKLADVPPLLPATLIRVEDRNFEHHFGVSPIGILRALINNQLHSGKKQGGSTLTQQLIRNLFLTNEQSYGRKIREALMAILLERHVSKDEILEAYLNEVWLGQDGSRAIHGFGLASQFYFNKPLNELRPAEIALLVGIAKGPTVYNPRKYPERVKERRDLVLRLMTDGGLIREDEREAEALSSLGVLNNVAGGVERYPAFIDLVRRQVKGLYREEDLGSEGLRIFTTLDPRAQEMLEARIIADLPGLEASRKMKADSLQAAGVVTSVEGGDVLAIVGDRNVRYPGFNRALDSQRPIGSLAKPFVFLAALADPGRYNLYSQILDEPVELRQPNGQLWAPKNYDRQLHGTVPLFAALAKSYNLPTVKVGLDIGVDRVHDLMQAAGLENPPRLPSMFLGAINASPLDVAQMYSTLAASGYLTPLLAIREVMTKDGKPLSRYSFKLKQTLPEGPVYLTTWAMQKVIEFGTARWAVSVLPAGQKFAGKTGTTDDARDSWFAGYGADRVAVIWVGRDDNKPVGLDGAAGALRIWGRLMRDLDARGIDLAPPAGIEEVSIDPQTGLRGDEGCAGVVLVPFLEGAAPSDYASCANAGQSSPLEWLKDIFR